jgi:MarR family transcriptional regulator, organic hydroperoxide resistance regulator
VNHVEELRYLILSAQREGNRAFAAALRDRGLTPSQAEALSVLQVAGRPLTVKEVGERLVCETGSPSRLMSMLIGKGLVESSSDEGDRRVTRLTLSEQGVLAAGAVAEAERAIYELMEGLIDPRDAERVSELLRRLVGELPTGRALARRIADGA